MCQLMEVGRCEGILGWECICVCVKKVSHKSNSEPVEDRVIIYVYNRHTCLANYGASEAVNLCNRYVEKSTKCSDLKFASSFRE